MLPLRDKFLSRSRLISGQMKALTLRTPHIANMQKLHTVASFTERKRMLMGFLRDMKQHRYWVGTTIGLVKVMAASAALFVVPNFALANDEVCDQFGNCVPIEDLPPGYVVPEIPILTPEEIAELIRLEEYRDLEARRRHGEQLANELNSDPECVDIPGNGYQDDWNICLQARYDVDSDEMVFELDIDLDTVPHNWVDAVKGLMDEHFKPVKVPKVFWKKLVRTDPVFDSAKNKFTKGSSSKSTVATLGKMWNAAGCIDAYATYEHGGNAISDWMFKDVLGFCQEPLDLFFAIQENPGMCDGYLSERQGRFHVASKGGTIDRMPKGINRLRKRHIHIGIGRCWMTRRNVSKSRSYRCDETTFGGGSVFPNHPILRMVAVEVGKTRVSCRSNLNTD